MKEKTKNIMLAFGLVGLILLSTFVTSIVFYKNKDSLSGSNKVDGLLEDELSKNSIVDDTRPTNYELDLDNKEEGPTINITFPEGSNVYLFGEYVKKMRKTLLYSILERRGGSIISPESARAYGPITIKTNVSKGSAPIRYVSFTITRQTMIEDPIGSEQMKLKEIELVSDYRVYEEPYQYEYKGSRVGTASISATVVDENGNSAKDTMALNGFNICGKDAALIFMHLVIITTLLNI